MPRFDFEKYHRKSIRLQQYDYSNLGAYFLTICTSQRECLFGEIVEGEMKLNEAGRIVVEELQKSILLRKEIQVDEYVIMPNHVHLIVWLVGAHGHAPHDDVDASLSGAQNLAPLQRMPRSLSTFVAGFKYGITSHLRALNFHGPIWQRNYYERIIRTDQELYAVRQYIRDNPLKWEEDPER